MKFSGITALSVLFCFNIAFSQGYDPQQVFDPYFLNSPGTAYRSGSGARALCTGKTGPTTK